MSVLYSLIDTLLPFEWTEFAYMKNAFLAVLLITPLFGLVGTMVVNNKMSFFSDALGHSALTGIAIGVLLGVDNYLLSMLGFALLFALCISAGAPGRRRRIRSSAYSPAPAWRWAWYCSPQPGALPSIPVT